MRFSDELLGSEGERCEVGFNVDGCHYTSEGVITAVIDNGLAVTVRFKIDSPNLHPRTMAAVPFERVTLLDSEDCVRALNRLNHGLPVTVTAHGVECEVKPLGRVEVDQTVGQHEAGWWVCLVEIADDDDLDVTDEWFLSDSGVLYESTASADELKFYVWESVIGYQLALQSNAIANAADEVLACEIDESAGLAGER